MAMTGLTHALTSDVENVYLLFSFYEIYFTGGTNPALQTGAAATPESWDHLSICTAMQEVWSLTVLKADGENGSVK